MRSKELRGYFRSRAWNSSSVPLGFCATSDHGTHVRISGGLPTTILQENSKLRNTWWAGRESNPDLQLRTLPCCSVTLPTHLELAPGLQPGSPDLENKVRTEASSCLRP